MSVTVGTTNVVTTTTVVVVPPEGKAEAVETEMVHSTSILSSGGTVVIAPSALSTVLGTLLLAAGITVG